MATKSEMEVIAGAAGPKVGVYDLSMDVDLYVLVLGVHNLRGHQKKRPDLHRLKKCNVVHNPNSDVSGRAEQSCICPSTADLA